MKYIFVLLCALVAMVCVNGQGVPTRVCPVGEHSVLLCGKAEPDCTNPTVHDSTVPGGCGVPQCFCDTPTVRDLSTGECVLQEDCPKNCA